ncbi:MAG: hypothetical protein AB7O43_21170, partial [Hyphomicrobiaceae bacterium]
MNAFEQFRSIGQPQLISSACQNMLDQSGITSPGVLSSLDRMFCALAVERIGVWEMPRGLPASSDQNHRWRAVSSLQKAIRLGDAYAAMTAAHICHGLNKQHLWRRLAVIAIEDVMLGNLLAVAMTLALAGSKAAREDVGDLKAALWMASVLANGLKDRTACDLCAVVDYDRTLHSDADSWARESDERLMELAGDRDISVERQMLAAWLLAGTRRYPGQNLPKANDRSRRNLMRVMVQSGMPLVLYYLADRGAVRTGDSMFVSVLPIWRMLQEDGDSLKVYRNESANRE